MRDYLIIESTPGDDLEERRSAEAIVLATGAWTKVAQRRWFSVFLETEKPPRYRHLPGVAGALIGEVFDAEAARAGRGQDIDMLGFGAEADSAARRLIERGFGRYVAILNDDAGPARVLRDPLGAMNAIGWRRGALRFIASRLPDIPGIRPSELVVDWQAAVDILRQKNLASLVTPLEGVVTFPPGVLADEAGRGARLWSPARFARTPLTGVVPRDLRVLVDGVVAAWVQRREGLFCEMSGGLDSAIVATSLASVGAPLRYGLNHAYPEREGDERRFAQDLADRIGVPLVVVERQPLRLTADKILAGAGGMRLNYAGGDPEHDADLAARHSEPGIDAMFTGCGGDGVFFQPAHPSLVRDVLRGRCGARLASLDVLARRNATTVWSILRRGLKPQDVTAGAGVEQFLDARVLTTPVRKHPWLDEARDIEPAKQLQILMLVNGLSVLGDSLHHAAGDVIDPLMSQPVVEFCLSAPAGVLAVGELNRPFARRAFAERLPASILERPSKGAVTNFILRSLGSSLDSLRPFLLDGLLAKAGVLDRERLDEALQREQFLWSNTASQAFILLAMEAWTRRWTGAQALGRAEVAYGAATSV
ncbi:asparagine synthase C-terminal domain-containing protein [Caulobacter sp. UNC279MFTsu5.1]|uniref:asparagine synthase-related protein n=1 Tax=Caulobacter sp. UNC279MFTsu5.1 TaxID=1502775 RepID=UPI000B7EFC57|nr:asparagine synthase C-terminal domain-containing protein [Caulobacter sp. UNC279MFTsu5.1]